MTFLVVTGIQMPRGIKILFTLVELNKKAGKPLNLETYCGMLYELKRRQEVQFNGHVGKMTVKL